ncbi:rho GTPase-activating protein 5 [Vigna radiata var. radiata]|uniref:Rho GTPase-activating protein 5 n=1 Tax=Vigna radiata var. radiata TaxID=3916 RepID=A0A1S3VNU3_VIGRR|nr:rho GTPase-activating protein 5 [Vigna radiata var. radiata]XP_014519749.1 rho GTPase-activating protein 5 [Vigna radiata var. radiata]XP_014519752.1 rho GTPase-activating protein 5 [Vigna radiata var. radiata]
MTEVLHFSSSSSPTASSSDGILIVSAEQETALPSSAVVEGFATVTDCEARGVTDTTQQELSLLAILVTLLRKSLIACKSEGRGDLCTMEIGWPTNVRHVAHVTFDRFNGFLGLPREFEPEVSTRSPSASATVFGVSTESMQLSYDTRGNSVPTILLLMQRHLYTLGGLQAEGIFRINADNTQEENVRDQLNRGLVPEDVDIHCLAGLIKAWFRELPTGVLDSLSPEQVMQCQTEDDCAELVRQLPHTEASLLDWAINLMADVVQEERLNKMNARNIAMVFAPNMTHMADPLTALMYAVQVMNFLKTLVLRTLRERKDCVVESSPGFCLEPSDENGDHSLLESCLQDDIGTESEESGETFVSEKNVSECSPESLQNKYSTIGECGSLIGSSENLDFEEELPCEFPTKGNLGKSKSGQSSDSIAKRGTKKTRGLQQPVIHATVSAEKKGISNLSRIDSRSERIEAWR